MNEAKILMNALGAKKKPFFFLFDFDLQKPVVVELKDLQSKNIFVDFNTYKNYNTGNHIMEPIVLNAIPISNIKYKTAFVKLQKEINYGNTYLCNLTFSTKLKNEESLESIFASAKAKYKIYYDGQWICFSPETFVQIQDNIISTNPMKGTIDSALPNAEQLLIRNEKEIEEHYTIVDLLRNDLSMVSKNVKVDKFRYVEKLETNNKSLLQVSSRITGEMDKNWHKTIGDTIATLLPAGSVTGAPKQKTIEIIKSIETHETGRGYYTGVAGIYDGKTLDSCVLIRFVQQTNDGLIYKSGGGITHQSTLDNEYKELNDKIYVPI
jgi:para-aminobenzoate synthetase component I